MHQYANDYANQLISQQPDGVQTKRMENFERENAIRSVFTDLF